MTSREILKGFLEEFANKAEYSGKMGLAVVWEKALRTDGPTDRRTDGRTDGHTLL